MKKHIDYSKEVKFQVGQRVELDLKEVPVEERETTTGIITKIDTHFPSTPKHRKIFYTIRFDGKGNYIKKEYQRVAGGIGFEFTCQVSRFKKI